MCPTTLSPGAVCHAWPQYSLKGKQSLSLDGGTPRPISVTNSWAAHGRDHWGMARKCFGSAAGTTIGCHCKSYQSSSEQRRLRNKLLSKIMNECMCTPTTTTVTTTQHVLMNLKRRRRKPKTSSGYFVAELFYAAYFLWVAPSKSPVKQHSSHRTFSQRWSGGLHVPFAHHVSTIANSQCIKRVREHAYHGIPSPHCAYIHNKSPLFKMRICPI